MESELKVKILPFSLTLMLIYPSASLARLYSIDLFKEIIFAPVPLLSFDPFSVSLSLSHDFFHLVCHAAMR